MTEQRRWWLCADHQPIARLVPTDSDFPWSYFRLHPFPRYTRYAPLFALEWRMCDYNVQRFAGTPQGSIAVKLMRAIQQRTYIVSGQAGAFIVWRDYYAHCDGEDFWVKYGRREAL